MVDRIVCLSVNDPWVMQAWQQSYSIKQEKIFFLPDGNGKFSEKLGMLADKPDLGGFRCDRFALYADNGVIKGVFREAPKQFEVSSADAMEKFIKTL